MRRLRREPRRRTPLAVQLLGPLLSSVVVSILLLAGLSEASAAREADGLVDQRGDTVLAGLAERLQEREDTQRVYGGLIATSEAVSDAIARGDDVAAAQALVPRRSRFKLGFVRAYDGDGSRLLDLGGPVPVDVQPLIASALTGIDTSTTQAVAAGLVLAAAVPVKGDSGIVGVLLVGRLLNDDALDDLARSKDLQLVVRRDGHVLASSGGLAVSEIDDVLSQADPDTEVSIRGVRYRVEDTTLDEGELLALVPVEDLRVAASKRRATTVVITLGLLLLLGGTAFIRARAIGGSLARMVDLAGRMADGEYDQRVPTTSTRELDELGVAVNNLADQIQARVDDLIFHARHDALTGLANRALLSERASAALVRRRGGTPGVLFIDLDNFKAINDSLGHEAGDRVITAVAQILREHVRAEDLAVRLGGDEFAVFVDDVTTADELVTLAERLLAALAVPLTLGDRQVVTSASIGIAVASDGQGDKDGETLLRNSDVAMYVAKMQGGRRYALFHADMHVDIVDRLILKADLSRALNAGELEVYYQPLVELATGAVSGVEALLRWHHPTRGDIPPTTFIPLAEESGLIGPIGLWVMQEACRQASAWAGNGGAPLRVSVNLSVRQLQSDSIIEDITGALFDAHLPPNMLTLEITESVLMHDGAVPELLSQIRAIGVRLAIDDFGTGYSSLAYLQQFPVDTIKIDQSFVAALGAGASDALVRSIIEIARALGAQTIAEGIENTEQATALHRLGCSIGQGYLFARPMPAALLADHLAGVLAVGS